MDVAIGVDSHKRTLAAAAVDALGRVLGRAQFGNDRSGHARLWRWAQELGTDRIIGIEGTGSYGAALSDFLVARGEDVREVPAVRAHRERRHTPTKGKSDTVDAEAIARVVARDDGLHRPKGRGSLEDLKLLVDHVDQLKRQRTRSCNRIHKHLCALDPGVSVGSLTTKRALAQVAHVIAGDCSVRADLVRFELDCIRRCDVDITHATHRIEVFVRASGTSLSRLAGVGDFLAAKILGEIGDLSRLRSPAAFAMMTATAPLSASSGATHRHRINRGGNRQLNRALHVMALTRARMDPETQAYLARQRAAGKSPREAIRCLKRQLSNVVYRQLITDLSSLTGELTT